MTWAALGFLFLGAALCAWRVVWSENVFDRVLAFDCLVLELIGIILLFSVITGSEAYMDAILVIGLLGFAGTVSLVAHLEEGGDD